MLKEKCVKVYLMFLRKSFSSGFFEKMLELFHYSITIFKLYSLRLPFLSEIFLERHMRIAKVFNRKFLKKVNKKIFIDIGAYVGFYSIYFCHEKIFCCSDRARKK